MRRPLTLMLLAGFLFFIAALTNAYDTERRPSNEGIPGAMEGAGGGAPEIHSLEGRLGYAVLVNAGYADVTMPADEQVTAMGFGVNPHLDNPEIACMSPLLTEADPSDTAAKVNGQFLLMSILAAEKYNRPAFMRSIEGLWARTTLALTGTVPDLSLGIAQIRPSAIRNALAQSANAVPLSEAELLDYALDDCSNVFAASIHLRALLQSVDSTLASDEIVAAAARLYNGGDNPTYVGAVTSAYQLLGGGGGELPSTSPASDEAAKTFDICVSFDPGSPDGQVGWSDYSEAAQPVIRTILTKTTQVSIAMVDLEPGPHSYLARLDDQRRQWLMDTLSGLGLSTETKILAIRQAPGSDCSLIGPVTASATLRIALPPGVSPPEAALPAPTSPPE